MNLEELKAKHPEVFAAALTEGRETGLKAGIEQGRNEERTRLLAIDAAAVPGHEQLTADAKKNGMEPGEYAQRVLAAEKVTRDQAAKALADDAPKPAPAAEPADAKGTIKRAEFNALSPADRQAKVKAGVKVVD